MTSFDNDPTPHPTDVVREALASGDLVKAARLASALSKEQPELEHGPQLLGMILAQAGRYGSAVTALLEAADRAPRKAEIRLQTAEVLELGKEYEAAMHACDAAIELRPTYDLAHDVRRRVMKTGALPKPDPLVTIVIPTTGADAVAGALASALAQDYRSIEVLLVADGPEAAERLPAVAGDLLGDPRVKRIDLPHNTGANGFNGHRIYGAATFLAQGAYFALLDEDNWHLPNHISSLVALVKEHDLDWAYSLRDIFDENAQPLGPDNCDALGHWPSVIAPGTHVVDTSVTLVRTDIAVRLASTWYSRYGDILSADLAVGRRLLEEWPRYGWTGQSTLCYRLRGTANDHVAQVFRCGNENMIAQRGTDRPWRKAGLAQNETPLVTAAAV
ncbi:MAG: hypothetical protein ACI8QC_002883 [Planctomycetota bacterium]|jgi:hypothetical protein